MSFDDLFDSVTVNNANDFRQLKVKYSDFICDNSDLITIINIIGNFIKNIDVKRILTNGYRLDNIVENKLKEYCERWSINAKVLKEMINFIMQMLKIFEFAIEEKRIELTINNLNSFQQPSQKQQNTIIDAICRYSYTSIARCVEVYKSESEKVKRLETLDYRQGRFFKSTLVKKTGLFYIYQSIIDIDE